MANSILNSLVGQSSFKLYSSDGRSVLSGVKVTRVVARFSGRLLKNIGEDGTPIIDTKIILPIEITVTGYADSQDAVSKINAILEDINGVYRLYSRGLYFERLTLASERLTQSSKVLSATPVDLVFNGIMRQDNIVPVTSQAGDSDTVIGGIVNTVEQDAEAAASKISSIVSSVL